MRTRTVLLFLIMIVYVVSAGTLGQFESRWQAHGAEPVTRTPLPTFTVTPVPTLWIRPTRTPLPTLPVSPTASPTSPPAVPTALPATDTPAPSPAATASPIATATSAPPKATRLSASPTSTGRPRPKPTSTPAFAFAGQVIQQLSHCNWAGIEGIVKNAAGSPLAGVSVGVWSGSWDGRVAVSEASGKYSLPLLGLPPGLFQVAVVRIETCGQRDGLPTAAGCVRLSSIVDVTVSAACLEPGAVQVTLLDFVGP